MWCYRTNRMVWILVLAIALGLAITLSVFSAQTGRLSLQIASAAVILVLGGIYSDFSWQDKSLQYLARRDRVEKIRTNLADLKPLVDVDAYVPMPDKSLHPAHVGLTHKQAKGVSHLRGAQRRMLRNPNKSNE